VPLAKAAEIQEKKSGPAPMNMAHPHRISKTLQRNCTQRRNRDYDSWAGQHEEPDPEPDEE